MKYLVVGLGSMGKRRVRNLTYLGESDIIGFDLQSERRGEAASSYGIGTYSTLDDALAQKPDALIVSTPPDAHMPFARAAVKHGMHVFTEASTSSVGMQEVSAAAKAGGLVAAASCTMRHHPSIRKMKELIAAGKIGKVLSFTHHAGQWLPDWHPNEDYRKFYVSRRETGACREIVPFELTWLNWLVGTRVSRVTAMRAKLSDLDCDIDDIYQLILGYENGPIGHLQIDVLDRAGVRHCRFIGTTGTLDWAISDRVVRHFDAATKQWTNFKEPEPKIEKGYSEMSNEAMYESEMAAFASAIRGDIAWDNSFDDEVAALDVLFAAEAASDSGQTQRLDCR
jgi:predicted dehydrogenase